MSTAKLQFWFEYGSTYSYLSVMRIEELGKGAGVPIDWRPFLLMPIFRAQGLDQGPFLPFPAKHSYMWLDLERRANRLGIAYRKPSVYPPDTLLTARIGLVAAREGWCAEFTRAVFTKHWTEDIPIGTEENLEHGLKYAGQDIDRVKKAATSEDNKLALRHQTETAAGLGIFGAPNFVVNGELFWGDDRLEEAVEMASPQ